MDLTQEILAKMCRSPDGKVAAISPPTGRGERGHGEKSFEMVGFIGMFADERSRGALSSQTVPSSRRSTAPLFAATGIRLPSIGPSDPRGEGFRDYFAIYTSTRAGGHDE
jgi:hypothetical protein